ncbi:flagellin [Temperatibacter marinus]|uniref:Flagellin n=1 Tax=Temperatibacter marinus TaxID=1456591 RepID=A0AA52HAD8_9PROT|nr:flagellin [Temperatibacter marinus]WND02498.1 flagellin [Temperatibacter marinus]
MAFSINTNKGALFALQQLNATNAKLESTQTQVNTGKKVASSKDNAAVFAIAQKLRSDISGLNAAKSSLDRALSTIDVAIAAGEAVSDLLVEMKEKAVSAKDVGLDSTSRASLNDDFTQLRDQISSIVDNAEFNGINAVKSGGEDIVAITNDTGANTITIAAQNLSLGSSVVNISSSDTISTSTSATTTVTKLESAITDVNSSLSKLGAGSKRLDLQKAFVGKLSDAIEVGIGNLVDADMAKTSAMLQSLQVKQQLGLQALGIANSAPQAITTLFQ